MCFHRCTTPDKVKDILSKCVSKQNHQYVVVQKQLNKLVEYDRFNLSELFRTVKLQTSAVIRAQQAGKAEKARANIQVLRDLISQMGFGLQNDSVWLILDMVNQFNEEYSQMSLGLVETVLGTKGLKQESVTGTFRCLLQLFAKCRVPIPTRVQTIYKYNDQLKHLGSGVSDAFGTVLLCYQLVQPNSAILRSLTQRHITQQQKQNSSHIYRLLVNIQALAFFYNEQTGPHASAEHVDEPQVFRQPEATAIIDTFVLKSVLGNQKQKKLEYQLVVDLSRKKVIKSSLAQLLFNIVRPLILPSSAFQLYQFVCEYQQQPLAECCLNQISELAQQSPEPHYFQDIVQQLVVEYEQQHTEFADRVSSMLFAGKCGGELILQFVKLAISAQATLALEQCPRLQLLSNIQKQKQNQSKLHRLLTCFINEEGKDPADDFLLFVRQRQRQQIHLTPSSYGSRQLVSKFPSDVCQPVYYQNCAVLLSCLIPRQWRDQTNFYIGARYLLSGLPICSRSELASPDSLDQAASDPSSTESACQPAAYEQTQLTPGQLKSVQVAKEHGELKPLRSLREIDRQLIESVLALSRQNSESGQFSQTDCTTEWRQWV